MYTRQNKECTRQPKREMYTEVCTRSCTLEELVISRPYHEPPGLHITIMSQKCKDVTKNRNTRYVIRIVSPQKPWKTSATPRNSMPCWCSSLAVTSLAAMVQPDSRKQHAKARLTEYSPVVLFQPKYRLGQPENNLFSLSVKIFSNQCIQQMFCSFLKSEALVPASATSTVTGRGHALDDNQVIWHSVICASRLCRVLYE